ARLARDAGEVEKAAAKLRRGLRLWRGEALVGLAEPGLTAAAHRLTELRLTATHDRVDVDIELGRSAEVVDELRALVRRHPSRQRLAAQLMTALHRGGRTVEAERVFDDLR